jgi:HAD superfamily hydrolase (TIGR01509 family)
MNMKEPDKFTAVIFDMDGLMFDTERIAIEAWRKAGADCGHDIPEALVIECIGRNTQDTQRLFEKALGQGFDFHHVRGRRLRYAEQHMARHGIPFKEGLLEVLKVLSDHAVPLAVATSTEKSRAHALLGAAGVFERFDTVVFGDDVCRGKPAPDIFLLAAERLRADPRRCVVLEDSDAGIRAASRARMRPILVPDIKAPTGATLRLAHAVFANLREVAGYFRDLLIPPWEGKA